MMLPMLNSALSTAPVGSRIKELEQRVAELTSAVEARDTFIAVAGHELRNAMTPLSGQIELLLAASRAGRVSPEQIGYRLGRMQQAVRYFLKRAAILLDVSRITSGKLHLELEPFDLASMLHELADEFTEVAQRMGIPLTLTVPDTLMVTWDRLALEQITDNLVANAIKYGSGTPIGIMARAEGGRVQIEICDGGTGIPAAERERVFERFERAIGPGERRSGFGVGLWVVGQLVTAMGGTVTVGDAPGGGALFTLNLPQHPEGAYS
jgi:two-component system OmpR family sensor kinase